MLQHKTSWIKYLLCLVYNDNGYTSFFAIEKILFISSERSFVLVNYPCVGALCISSSNFILLLCYFTYARITLSNLTHTQKYCASKNKNKSIKPRKDWCDCLKSRCVRKVLKYLSLDKEHPLMIMPGHK